MSTKPSKSASHAKPPKPPGDPSASFRAPQEVHDAIKQIAVDETARRGEPMQPSAATRLLIAVGLAAHKRIGPRVFDEVEGKPAAKKARRR
jgi:hypothetical protein